MSIVVDIEPGEAGDKQRMQLIKQINKLINVLQASDLTEMPAVRRELALVRVRSTMQNRTAILKEAEIFGAARSIPRSKALCSKPPAIRRNWTNSWMSCGVTAILK